MCIPGTAFDLLWCGNVEDENKSWNLVSVCSGNCNKCDVNGPGKCDTGECHVGWALDSSTKTCLGKIYPSVSCFIRNSLYRDLRLHLLIQMYMHREMEKMLGRGKGSELEFWQYYLIQYDNDTTCNIAIINS